MQNMLLNDTVTEMPLAMNLITFVYTTKQFNYKIIILLMPRCCEAAIFNVSFW